ncbi:sensor histidine kinase [Pseudoruegeria sp. SHC-113]|uniref:sensor histidine kinase n=1 Tax=Pseudoruegeria sp. SHC-113 TaxID=2855439 RepID=UPI0021BB2F8D|nr:sensor histidine kinase [Pseudoruegeria sp. SHC-113]MCT8161896.1 sensor histidine kinase N-terminal domain-containing protein [Pseudoruegeria sp. SHC-113]
MKPQALVSGSIRRRLTLQLVGSAAVLAVLLFLLVLGFARRVAEESQDNILTASLTSILESVAVQDGALTADIPYAALSMLGNVSNDRVFYAIRAAGADLTGYADLPRTEQEPRAGETLFLTADYKGESLRLASAARIVSVQGAPTRVTASVAQTRNGQAATLERISTIAAVLGVGFFLVSAALAILAAQAAVKPLNDLAGSVSRRGPKDLRPVVAPVPSEMAPLVVSLNGFIARLKVSLARSEDFIAEAAHRVRTPLATVRMQAEIALRRVERPENRKALKEMIRAVDESSRAAGQLLDHAMVTFRTDSLEREALILAELAEDLVGRLGPVADLKEISLQLEARDPGAMEGDAILLQNAIRNLLDNAIKYSPADSVVTVLIDAPPGALRLQVQDEGPGFPEGAEQLTARFARGSNVSGTVGSGLGLTIAKEVAEAHGGSLMMENREGGGACVSLVFPVG